MSFSKNVKHCRRCVSLPLRQYHLGGSNTIEPPKMQAKTSVMALTQWKVLSQLKDYVSKFSNDKTFQNAFNKEFAQLLQKFQPSVYGSEIVRNFESSVNDQKLPAKTDVKSENETKTEQAGLKIQSVFNGLMKRSKEETAKEVIPHWKIATPTVSKTSISSRTRQLLFSIETAESETSKLTRVDSLISHLVQYPEAKSYAVKDGAIRMLLKMRDKAQCPEVLGSISEAFALLGYACPPSGKGIKILSIDGGGVRGLLVIEMLKKLEELTGKPVYEMFDYICGVSTGAILACSLSARLHDLEELSKDYKELSTKVFTQSPIWGTSNLVWSHSYYDTALWEKLLMETFGEGTLIKTARNPKVPKLAAVSAVVNQSRLSAFVFRNYSLPWRVQSEYMGSSDYKLWQAVRASAAAPTYFEEFKLGDLLHQDGGILVNNPTAVAIHEAKLLWPGIPIQCVVSFGTGRSVSSHNDAPIEPTSNSSWKHKFLKIIDSATDTEGVHTMLNDLLPGKVYYRFNPYLTEMLTMSEIAPKKLEQLEMDAVMYLRRNEDKFREAASTLNETKSHPQQLMDWVNLKQEIYGLDFK